MSNQKRQATVKWFSDEKGIGFLLTPNGDAFVHYRSIEPQREGYKTLKTGQRVEYTPITTDKGLSAAEVSLLQ